MVKSEISFSMTEIVAYANRLNQSLVPRIVKPIFRNRENSLLIFPPYRIEKDGISDYFTGDEAELERLVDMAHATKIDQPILGKPDHLLWVEYIEKEHEPRYQRRGIVQKLLKDISDKKIKEANIEALRGNFNSALALAQTAFSADEENLRALVVKAAIWNITGNAKRIGPLSRIARDIDPSVEFLEHRTV